MNETLILTRYPFFTTREFALLAGIDISSASRRAGNLAQEGILVRVTRGLWASTAASGYTPMGAVNFLLGNEQGYVSFLSALHLGGVISQIPASTQIATTGHTRRLDSPIGRFDFLHMKPVLMRAGIELSGTNPAYPFATAEKALLDTVYISSRKGRRFASLPELDLEALNADALREMFQRMPLSRQVASAMATRLDALLAGDVRQQSTPH